jgi:hypothetical protein
MNTHPDRWLKNVPSAFEEEFHVFYNADNPERISPEFYWVLLQAYRFLREIKTGGTILKELIHFASQKNMEENLNSTQQTHHKIETS